MNRIKKKNIKGILVSILAFFMPIFVSAQTTPPTVTDVFSS